MILIKDVSFFHLIYKLSAVSCLLTGNGFSLLWQSCDFLLFPAGSMFCVLPAQRQWVLVAKQLPGCIQKEYLLFSEGKKNELEICSFATLLSIIHDCFCLVTSCSLIRDATSTDTCNLSLRRSLFNLYVFYYELPQIFQKYY